MSVIQSSGVSTIQRRSTEKRSGLSKLSVISCPLLSGVR